MRSSNTKEKFWKSCAKFAAKNQGFFHGRIVFINMTSERGMKSFVSESEVEEFRKKRQEEWEKVRQPDDPLGE